MAKEQVFEHPPRGHVAILYYDPTNDRYQVVEGDDVDTAIPATAKSMLTSALAHGYDGTVWRKLPMLWGYTDRYLVSQQNVSDVAATYVVDLPAVDSGEVWRVLGVGVWRDTVAGQYARLTVAVGVPGTDIEDIDVPAIGRFYNNSRELVLRSGDNIRVQYIASVVGEIVITTAWGYKMKVTM